ncbi:MAG: hypothetical protein AB4426_02320 [Xenococcaceae cyanobacterium]
MAVERVAFLVEQTGVRISCLLNPQNLVMRRRAGIKVRQSLGGGLTGIGLADDALLYTGGGMTELQLDLLFDVAVAGSSINTEDVRDLTAPLWQLAENAVSKDGYRQAPKVRFVWGKSWNIPGVVAAVAERLEQFSPTGVPRRSWLRLRFLRVFDPPRRGQPQHQDLPPNEALNSVSKNISQEQIQTYKVRSATTRPDQIAAMFYQMPGLWRRIMSYSQIDDPLHIELGVVLRVPFLHLKFDAELRVLPLNYWEGIL